MKGYAFKDLKTRALSKPEVTQAFNEADYELGLFQSLYDK